MFLSTPAFHALFNSSAMSKTWYCFPLYIQLNIPSMQEKDHLLKMKPQISYHKYYEPLPSYD